MSILLVVTSCNELLDGTKSGYYLPELAHPYYEFVEAGFKVDIASPKGGLGPVDPSSVEPFKDDPECAKFQTDQAAQKLIQNTITLDSVDEKLYKAIFYVGGAAPAIDLPSNKTSIKLIETFYASGRPTSAVCHGPVVFDEAKTKDGQYIVKGKKVTAFSNQEEEIVKGGDKIPFTPEDSLRRRGGIYSQAEPWQEFIQVDGNLLTGQNPASGKALAKAVIKQLQ